MLMTLDTTELPASTRAALHKVCTDENAVALMQAKLRQRKCAEFWHRNGSRSLEGFGAQTMSIDPYFLTYFKMKERTDPCHDPDFAKWLMREDDVFKVKSRGTKTQVGWISHGDTEPQRKKIPLSANPSPCLCASVAIPKFSKKY